MSQKVKWERDEVSVEEGFFLGIADQEFGTYGHDALHYIVAGAGLMVMRYLGEPVFVRIGDKIYHRNRYSFVPIDRTSLQAAAMYTDLDTFMDMVSSVEWQFRWRKKAEHDNRAGDCDVPKPVPPGVILP